MHQCQSKQPIVILKLDFEKAFDSVELEFIFQILKCKGFNSKWILWTQQLLSSGSSFVLLNGVLGKNIMSPLLFAIIVDFLQTLVNQLLHYGLIQLPIPCHDKHFPIVQYADDIFIILPAVESQLLEFKKMFLLFSQSTGLHVNYHKSALLPINIDQGHLQTLADSIGCKVGSLPFTYLGLPVGTTKPRIIDLMTLVYNMERRLFSSSSFLAQGGRLQYLNSALSSVPHFSSAVWIYHQGFLNSWKGYKDSACGGKMDKIMPLHLLLGT